MNLILCSGLADVNIPTYNEQRMTPLHIAVIEQHLLITKMLLTDFKAEVDCTDYINNTPLHYAVINGNIKLVKILLSRFPKIDIENFDGQTVLDL